VEFNTLTTTLTNFVSAFQGGYSRLQPAINGLLGVLAGIEIVLIGFWWALSGGERLANVIKKILFLGFWLWLTTSFQTTSKAFVDSLIQAGLTAGGKPGGYSLLLDPSRIAGYGLQATEALSKALDNIGFDLVDAIIFGLAYIAIMVSFLVMAIQVFLAVLQYYLLAAVVGILIPFGILPQTKFLAEKAIGAIVSAGVKLMVLAFVMAVVEPVLSNVRFSGTEIKLNELWSVLLTCGGIAFLTWNAPSLVAGLLAGSPSLGAASAAQSVTSGAMLAAGAVGGMVAATRAATSLAAGATGHRGDGQGPSGGSGSSGGAGGGGSLGPRSADRLRQEARAEQPDRGPRGAGGSIADAARATSTPSPSSRSAESSPAAAPTWVATVRSALRERPGEASPPPATS
jgi:type IV secretion system protein TrbL